jgi:hypothetical protein
MRRWKGSGVQRTLLLTKVEKMKTIALALLLGLGMMVGCGEEKKPAAKPSAAPAASAAAPATPAPATPAPADKK